MSRTSEGLEPWVYDHKIPQPDEPEMDPQIGNRISMTEQDYLENQVELNIDNQIKEQKLNNMIDNTIRLERTPVTYPREKDTTESITRGVQDEKAKPEHNEVEYGSRDHERHE